MVLNYLYIKSNIKPAQCFTIFAIPKPFTNHVGIIQHNAITSWTLLTPQPEIILFGDEEGTAEIAQKFGLIHIPKIKRNEYGTPLLDSVFADVHHLARNNILVYLNADIILIDDFSIAIQQISEKLTDFLVIGRRWNIKITKSLDFHSSWKTDLQKLVQDKGRLANYDCKDYFIFPKHLLTEIPSFAVGRGYWDTWIVNQALRDSYPVVDASQIVTAIHQDHPYTHIRGGKNEAYMGKEAQSNKILGNVTQPGNIASATWQLKSWEQKESPRVSVVIASCNQAQTLEKAVLSVLIQDYQDYEIIVVANSSKYSTKTILQPYQHKIKYVEQDQQGILAAYDYGLKLALGEFIIFLHGGSVLLPKALNKQVASFEREASTLDLLLSGRQVVERDTVVEYQPWQNYPNLKDLPFGQSEEVLTFLSKSTIMFRHSRLNLIWHFNHDSAESAIWFQNILKKACFRDFRIICLEENTISEYAG